ncbi:hypothetical protein NPIL_651661 [Nephila pilipes]|uniref:Uncharacterized protein n=1 Tax=Nephila pilipes TaxID=299642 RepID=A0A8X6IZ22_NEPPI|nr:hypothetical protein NPIL_651661 [Nephila pilipes]
MQKSSFPLSLLPDQRAQSSGSTRNKAVLPLHFVTGPASVRWAYAQRMHESLYPNHFFLLPIDGASPAQLSHHRSSPLRRIPFLPVGGFQSAYARWKPSHAATDALTRVGRPRKAFLLYASYHVFTHALYNHCFFLESVVTLDTFLCPLSMSLIQSKIS